jgi:hypothetical protein
VLDATERATLIGLESAASSLLRAGTTRVDSLLKSAVAEHSPMDLSPLSLVGWSG